MNKLLTTFTLLFFTFFLKYSIFSQSCENADFSLGNFNYWETYTGYCCGAQINTLGVVNGRHTIITQSTLDPLTNNTISTMPPTGGGAFSVKLGNESVGSEAERLKKSFLITEDTKLFIYQYALVLQDPDGHTPLEKPKFEVKVFDQNGILTNPVECSYYQVTAGPETDTWGVNGEIRYKDWATVGLDLSDYMGTVITIEFTVQDCGLGGHFGYAYLDANCGFLDIKVIGFCDGSDQVTLIAPDGFSSYYWPHSGETTQTVVIPVPQEGDSITVDVTNESGCTSSILHVFEELPLPYADAGNDTSLCVGEQIQLWSEGAGVEGQYTWYKDGQVVGNTQILNITPIESDVYTVYVANANGCFSSDSSAIVTIDVNDSLLFYLPNDTTICYGSSMSLNCTVDNVTYNWTTNYGDTFPDTSSIIVTPQYTTTYYLEVQNSSCTYIDSILVTVQDSESFDDTTQINFCNVATTTTIQGPFGCQFYNWSNGSSSDFVTVNAVTSEIELQFITFFGCPDSILYQLSEIPNPVPVIDPVPDTACFAANLYLVATSDQNCYYTWTSIPSGLNTNNNYVVVNPTQTTTYIVQATNFSGCSGPESFDSITVQIDSSAYFELESSVTMCQNDDIVIAVENVDGILTWVSQGVIIDYDSTITVSPSSSQYYYLTQEVGNCTYSDNVEVTVVPVNTMTETINVCFFSPEVVINAPTAGYTSFFWPSFSNNATSNTLTNPLDGQVIPIYCVTSEGCTDTLNNTIDLIEPSSLLPLSDQSICAGESVTLTANSNGTNDLFSWTSIPIGYTSTGATMNDTPLFTTTYTVTLSNDLNCVDAPISFSSLVTVKQPQTITVPSLVSLCVGDSLYLEDSSLSGTTTWTFDGIIYPGSVLNIMPVQSGDAVIMNSFDGCTTSETTIVQINNPETFQIVASPNNPVCSGDYVSLTVNPNSFNSIEWDISGQTISTAPSLQVQANQAEVYSATIEDLGSCVANVSYNLIVNTTPAINLGEDQEICSGKSTVLTSLSPSSGASYIWSTTETSTSITVNTSGTYWLQISDNNCSSVDSVIITFLSGSYIGEIPNVITINGDGTNDEFFFDYMNLENFELVIMNRWGNRIFTSSDPSIKWDGTCKGKKVDNGVYFYTITFVNLCENSEKTELKGNITVIGE